MDALLLNWICAECADKHGLLRETSIESVNKCVICDTETWTSPVSGRLPKIKKPRKRSKPKNFYVPVPMKMKKKLQKKAKQIGCSVHSLVVNYLNDGLNPKMVSAYPSYSQEITRTQTATIKKEERIKTSGPVGYQAPTYFAELKEVLERRNKKKAT